MGEITDHERQLIRETHNEMIGMKKDVSHIRERLAQIESKLTDSHRECKARIDRLESETEDSIRRLDDTKVSQKTFNMVGTVIIGFIGFGSLVAVFLGPIVSDALLR